MTRGFRIGLFLAAAAALGALLLWAAAGIPGFGDYSRAYGLTLNHVAPTERQTSNVVASVVFDYRGLDTMGEEFILFTAVMGVALLLREPREKEKPEPEDPVLGDAVRAGGIALAGVTLVLGLYVVAHGYISPGGGFQGGVVLARDLLRQALLNSFFGLVLVVLFLVFQAPDVALSALAVGGGAAPLVILATLAKLKGRR